MRVFLLVLGAAVTSVLAQVDDGGLNNLEEKAFILPNGWPYRDMLTIGASQAVAEFAARHQPVERQRVTRNRVTLQRNGGNDIQSPQFYSATLNQPIGRPNLELPDFSASRRFRISQELTADRLVADRDEAVLIQAGLDRDRELAKIGRNERLQEQQRGRGPRPSQLRRQPQRGAQILGNRLAGNFASVSSHGQSYSTNIDYGTQYNYDTSAPNPASIHSLGAPQKSAALTAQPRGFSYQTYVPVAAPGYAAGSKPYAADPYAAAHNPSPGVNYGYDLTTGSTPGTYSYSSLG